MDRRSFIRLTSLSMGSLILPNVSFASNDSSDLEKLIHREYVVPQFVARRDNQYLIDNLDEETKNKILDIGEFKGRIAKNLVGLKHADYEKHRRKLYKEIGVTYGGSYDVFRLNARQLARVHLFLEALVKEDFREEIMEQLRADIADLQTEGGYLPAEIGGLVKYDDGELYLYPIESLDAKKDYDSALAAESNHRYIINGEEIANNPNLGRYHLHAVRADCTKYAGPSFDVKTKSGRIIGDINATLDIIKNQGESHSFVITKLKGNSFNVCYYGGELDSADKPDITVLSLGDWKAKEDSIEIN